MTMLWKEVKEKIEMVAELDEGNGTGMMTAVSSVWFLIMFILLLLTTILQLETLCTQTIHHYYKSKSLKTHQDSHIIPMKPILFKFRNNLTINNRFLNSEINMDCDEYTLDPKSFDVMNDLFDTDILPTLDDWKNK